MTHSITDQGLQTLICFFAPETHDCSFFKLYLNIQISFIEKYISYKSKDRNHDYGY